eukprot:2184438-Pleurochrysis_carterae.AAC.3
MEVASSAAARSVLLLLVTAPWLRRRAFPVRALQTPLHPPTCIAPVASSISNVLITRSFVNAENPSDVSSVRGRGARLVHVGEPLLRQLLAWAGSVGACAGHVPHQEVAVPAVQARATPRPQRAQPLRTRKPVSGVSTSLYRASAHCPPLLLLPPPTHNC